MRILFTMTGSWGTGSGTIVEGLVRRLSRRGHECAVLYPAAPGMPDAQIKRAPEATHLRVPFPVREEGVELPTYPLMIPDSRPGNPDGTWTYSRLSKPQLKALEQTLTDALEGAIEYFQPDVVECQHIWLMAAIATRADVPFVAAAHHSDQSAFRDDPRMQPLALQAAHAARRIFALSDAHREEIIALYGLSPERVEVTGYGYNRAVFFPRRVERDAVAASLGISLPVNSPVVAFSGDLAPNRGVGVLLEANKILSQRMATPPTLLLFGAGNVSDVHDSQIRNRAESELEGVYAVAHQPASVVADVYNIAHCFVMPPRPDGLGLAAIEAMACGLPIVSGNLGGHDEVGVCVTVPPGDAAALANAIERLVTLSNGDHSELRAQALAAAGQYSWASIVDARLSAYQYVGAVAAD
jgi:glycosyltransferase involved in cell wall biosynthesis